MLNIVLHEALSFGLYLREYIKGLYLCRDCEMTDYFLKPILQKLTNIFK